MYVSRVALKNIRGVGEEGLLLDLSATARSARDGLAGWFVIAGPNGAGKTTLLQAMAASLLGGSGTTWLFRPEDRRDWIHRGAAAAALSDRGSTCVWIERVIEDDGAPLSDRRIGPVPLRVEWPRDPSSVREVSPEGEHSAVLSQFWHAAAFGSVPQGWLFAAYGPHRGNRQSSPDAASLFRAAPRTAAAVTLFRQDAGLDATQAWLTELELRAARSGGEALLRDSVLRLLGAGLLIEGEQTPMRIEADGLHVEWQGAFRPARLLGDGYFATLALVADLLLRIHQFMPDRLLEELLRWGPDGDVQIAVSGVVVIDEPESHLHPDLQQRLGFWLTRVFPRLQFIVTTHSPLVCQAAGEGGLFRMAGRGGIEAVDAATWAMVVNGTLDSAVVSQLFGLASATSEAAAQRRRRLAALNIQRRRGQRLSDVELAELAALERSAPSDPNFKLDSLVLGLLTR